MYCRSSQLCSLLCLEWLLYFEVVVRSLINTCLFGIHSLNHIPLKYSSHDMRSNWRRTMYLRDSYCARKIPASSSQWMWLHLCVCGANRLMGLCIILLPFICINLGCSCRWVGGFLHLCCEPSNLPLGKRFQKERKEKPTSGNLTWIWVRWPYLAQKSLSCHMPMKIRGFNMCTLCLSRSVLVHC
jgi:hypothetical protein